MSDQKRARMRAAVAYLQKYMNTYSDQIGYEDYHVGTLINDVLYGLGVAVQEIDGEDYQFALGFDRFRARLLTHIAGEIRPTAPNPPLRSKIGLEGHD